MNNGWTRDDWTGSAACRQPGVDPEWFFPVAEAGPALADVARAKAVCARCPVARECLSWALRVGEPEGIWGGTTPGERRHLRRARHARRTRRPEIPVTPVAGPWPRPA